MLQETAEQVAWDAFVKVTLTKTGVEHLSLRLAAALPHKKRVKRAVELHKEQITQHAKNAFSAGKRVLRGISNGNLSHQAAEEAADAAVEAVRAAFARDLEELLLDVVASGAGVALQSLKAKLRIALMRSLGGPGSGNFGHGGRPGVVGGSESGESAGIAAPVPQDRAKQVHDLKAQGLGNSAIAKRMGWHYSEGKRVQRVLDNHHPDGTPKVAGPHVHVPVVEPKVEPKAEPLGEQVHEKQLREITSMRETLRADRVRVSEPYSIDPNTTIGRQNIGIMHNGLTQTLAARQAMRDAGVKPPAISLRFNAKESNVYATAQGQRITINTKQASWKDPYALRHSMQGDHSVGFHPTSDPHAIMVHEMGHTLHYNADKGQHDRTKMVFYGDHQVEEHLARQVSRYAATNHREFVAETFTGLVAGKSYSHEVMARYRDLKGPHVHGKYRASYDYSSIHLRPLHALQALSNGSGLLRSLPGANPEGDHDGAELARQALPWGSRDSLRGEEGLRTLGGRGSGNFDHGGRKGEVGGSAEGGGGVKDRAERARAAHNVFTKQKEAWATGNEKQVVQMVKGEGTDNNLPVDVIVRDGNKTIGIEVKTMLDNKAGKITMRSDALVRKAKWARSNHGSLHTLILDDRDKFGAVAKLYSGHRVYYQKGVGSFRLSTMTKVKDAAHLGRLLRGKRA